MNIHVVIGPLTVDGMTAQQPDIVAGYPAPTAVAGLGHKFALDLSASGKFRVRSAGTAVIVHDHSLMEGHVKLPLEDKAKIRQNKGANILDERRARVTASLIIQLECVTDVEDEALLAAAERIVPTLYFGGGKVFPKAEGTTSKVTVAKSGEALIEAIYSLPAGYALVDRSDLLDGAPTDRDPLDALLDILELVPHDAGEGQAAYSRRNRGWLVPVFVGYQAIERQRQRSGLRSPDAVAHVFAESVYSVGEFRSIRSMISQDSGSLSRAFWKHTHNPRTETFLVSAAN